MTPDMNTDRTAEQQIFQVCREFGSYESVLLGGEGIARLNGRMSPVERRGTMLHPCNTLTKKVDACLRLLDLQVSIERAQYACDTACNHAELDEAEARRKSAIADRDSFVSAIGATIEWV